MNIVSACGGSQSQVVLVANCRQPFEVTPRAKVIECERRRIPGASLLRVTCLLTARASAAERL